MVLVASCVPSMLKIDIPIVVSLGELTPQVSIFLLCVHVLDQSFLRLEVESHRIALVLLLSHLEDRSPRDSFLFRCVTLSCGMDQTAVKTHVDFLTRQVHVFILHVRLPIKMGGLGEGIVHQRVIGGVVDRGINAIFLLTVGRVQGDRVVDQLVATVDGQLDGIHLGGIRSSKPQIHLIGRSILHSCRIFLICPRLLMPLEDRQAHVRHHINEGKQKEYYERFSSH